MSTSEGAGLDILTWDSAKYRWSEYSEYRWNFKILEKQNLRKYTFGNFLTIAVKGLCPSSEMGWGKGAPRMKENIIKIKFVEKIFENQGTQKINP